jgi:hypothetical protein
LSASPCSSGDIREHALARRPEGLSEIVHDSLEARLAGAALEKVLAGGIGYTARSICMPGGVPGCAVLIELNGSRRNWRNSFMTTTPTRYFELDGIVELKAARDPLQWPRSTALVVPSGNRHLYHMGWTGTNYELNR